ncbi:hypothetical protein LTR78_003995 [Recurvomyces mirabilis]|uniref:Mitotic checkpoint regulator, MAD2B-interacting-domain-containing protein n=1 Tax=Recurvomyces mirabilis TaxID=574656 RepID=A0AAE0WQV3_9PEZI|nr:hypothetical protein LTR78_003995 [Recurvomyces mirabilis]KAK5153867.1 hypothetical protein LTS14_007087 [Recurvomyces mirabilis]
MALVSYSDSEGSDNEVPAIAPKAATAKPTIIHKTESRKIKVDLPTTRPEPSQTDEDGAKPPPAKRARTTGAFGGFNSMLPAPKRAEAQPSGLKKGVSLKTSSEAAFSRAPLPPPPAAEEPVASGGGADNEYDEYGNKAQTASTLPAESKSTDVPSTEVKITGKATRFRPLSVANNKKKKAVKKSVAPVDRTNPAMLETSQGVSTESTALLQPVAPAVKVKKSLFSLQQEEAPAEDHDDEDEYNFFQAADEAPPDDLSQSTIQTRPAPNALEEVATDLNLTAAQRRHLFGRQGKNGPANIAHFNMDAEYANNEVIRQSGETVQHKAVKAVAPGKHSLQQLVNNARSNQDSIEDKWAEGRRNRGEGGSKYGWSNG